MRLAAQIFYLAVFALLGPSRAESHGTLGTQSSSPDSCAVRCSISVHSPSKPSNRNYQIDPKAIVSDACASFSTLDTLNTELRPSLKAITQETDFFAYYRLNLFNRVCPFWDDANSMCGNIACVVNTLDDEKDIPLIWRAEELSKLEGPKAAHPGRQLQQERGSQRPLQGTLGDDVGESCVVEYDDECDNRDYCLPEDESATAKGDYVSLVDNPERFTGYAGEGAHMVWDAIYKENCFSRTPEIQVPSPPSGLHPIFQAVSDLRSVIRANSPPSSLVLNVDDSCLEKRVFHRIISGMHASISTHICHAYLNQTTGLWSPNLQCYIDRLDAHPERISNLYFNYALLLRAITKLRTYIKSYTFCSGDPIQDASTKAKMLQLTDSAAAGPEIFDETQMFADPSNNIALKEDFRNRFRNVSRLMDCVGCDKCRLWGKLQTVGYGTALKVLFEYDETKNGENPALRRTELVALVNTLDRVSDSLRAVGDFKDMLARGVPPSPEPPMQNPASIFDTPISESSSSKSRSPPIDQSYPSSDSDFDSDSDSEDTYDPPPSPPTTLWNEVTGELTIVYRAFIYVLTSWLQMPGKMFSIAIMEADRLWSFWLGLPIRPRTWGIRLPSREEL